MKVKKKNLWITGSGGFVGRNLVEHLSNNCKDKYTVFAPTHKELELLDSNKVEEYIKTNGIDLIVHCASTGGSRKTGYDEGRTDIVSANLRMFHNLARCLTPKMRMINMGSGAEYDKSRPLNKVKEDNFDEHIPKDDYGFSKYVISKYIEKVDNIICLRVFGLYGRYEDYRYKFISNAIVKNLLRMPITINQNVVFDYLYIDDFTSIVEHLIEKKPRYKFMNATPQKSIDLVSIAKIINKIGDFKSQIRVLSDGMNREYSGENGRLQKVLEEFKFTSYEEGIRSLYCYYKSVLDTLDFKTIKADPYLKYCKTV